MKTASLGSDPLMAHQLLLLSRTSLCLPSERMVLHDSESKPAKAVLKEKLEFLLKNDRRVPVPPPWHRVLSSAEPCQRACSGCGVAVSLTDRLCNVAFS